MYIPVPHLPGKATQRNELIPHPLRQGKRSKTPQSPTHAPCLPGVGVKSDRCIIYSYSMQLNNHMYKWTKKIQGIKGSSDKIKSDNIIQTSTSQTTDFKSATSQVI